MENVIEVPIHVLGRAKAEAIETADVLLHRVGLYDKREAYPAVLSGGQQQRAAIAKEYQTQDEINQDLISGRIDATQVDSLAIEDFLKSKAGKACCELKGTVAPDPAILGPGVGVGLRKGDDKLKAKINAAIAAIRANGKYDEISKKYFDFDIFGQ